MTKEIKILIVEDREDDAVLVVEQFRESGYKVESRQVWTAESMRAALTENSWDAVICDHSMPGFDSRGALKVLAEVNLDLPFIIVSGSIGESEAVEIMKAGAHDYIVKDFHLTRLVTATERELREAQNRHARKKAELHQKFLAEASEVLASSLNFEETAQRVLSLAVPILTDHCFIDLKFGLGLENFQRPRLVQKMSETDLRNWSYSEEHLEELKKLNIHSALSVPLCIRDKVVGIVTFFSTLQSNRVFDQMDLSLAEDLARRMAVAFDNSNLYQKAQEAIRIRDEFLCVASHELRTPLTSLKLTLQGLLRAFQKESRVPPSNEKIAGSLKMADSHLVRFSKLIDELLNVSRISLGKLELNREAVDISSIVMKVAARFKEEMTEKGSSLVLDISEGIAGEWDASRIEQSIENLLSNAIRFGEGKPIKVSLRSDGVAARLSVEDQGIGIVKEDQLRIFERFERAVPTRNYGGLGMGLYITRQIAEAHGGSISVESAPGKGSKFIIKLPIKIDQRLSA